MKNVLVCATVVAGLVLLPACDWFGSSEKSVEKSSQKPRARLVNVLDKQYFDDMHIMPGSADVVSVNAPFVAPEEFMKEAANWEKDVPVVTYCADYMCMASHDAAKALMDAGFENVSVYSGGSAEWYQLNQQDPSFALAGPAKAGYLTQENKRRGHAEGNIKEISAQELQNMIK